MQVGWELRFMQVSLDGLQGASLVHGEIEPSTQIRAHSAHRDTRALQCVRQNIALPASEAYYRLAEAPSCQKKRD